jgi:hypothetical protein
MPRKKTNFKKFLNEKYLALFVCIGISIYFTCDFFTHEFITSPDHLIEVRGNLQDYSFQENPGGWRRPRTFQYYLYLDNYSNTFQIPASWLPYFKAPNFVAKARPGDRIVLKIPKRQQSQLNTDENILVAAIRLKNTHYLRAADVIENEEPNGPLYVAIGVLVFGLGFFWWRSRPLRPSR